jgi:hypothetical protein
MAMREPVPRWFGDFEQERRAARQISDREQARQDYREELMADAVHGGRLFAEKLVAAFVDRSELTAEDFKSLRDDGEALVTRLSAIASALRYAEAIQ